MTHRTQYMFMLNLIKPKYTEEEKSKYFNIQQLTQRND